MIGTLNHEQIENVLNSEMVGRIGYNAEGRVYIIPIAFKYDSGYIYAHSRNGTKIKQMRKSPHVSFQVDSIDNLANWRSVLLHGKFEELKDNKEQQRAMVMIQDRIKPFVASESTKPYGFSKAPQVVEKPYRTIVYRIKIETESGRFEKSASE